MTGAVDLSVIIVSHGHEDMLPACIGSLLGALEGLTFEIVAIDNLPLGRLSAALAGLPVSIRSNARPIGFAANVNQGVRASAGRNLLVLNPDTRHEAGRLADALAFLDSRSDVGIVGCTLLNADRTRQQSYRRFPSLAIFLARGFGADNWPWKPGFYRHGMMEGVAPHAPHAVDWVFGAFMLMRRHDFGRLGGMDERFRLYYEDVDLCYRYREIGLSTWVYPALSFVHVHLRHSAKRPLSASWRWHVGSAARYFWKTSRLSRISRMTSVPKGATK